jgi:hypothetical protein
MIMNAVSVWIWKEGVVICWQQPSCQWPGEAKIPCNCSVRIAGRLTRQRLEPVTSEHKSIAFLVTLQLYIYIPYVELGVSKIVLYSNKIHFYIQAK